MKEIVEIIQEIRERALEVSVKNGYSAPYVYAYQQAILMVLDTATKHLTPEPNKNDKV